MPQFNQFLAVGHQSQRVTSVDGVTWSKPATQKERGYAALLSIAQGNGSVVAVGPNGGQNVYMRTTDLQTWETSFAQESKGDSVRYVAFGNNQFVTYGNDGGNLNAQTAIQTSSDGKQWAEKEKRPKMGPKDMQKKIYRSVWGNGMWVAIGTQGLKTVSKDGKTWQDSTDVAESLIDIVFAKGVFVGVGLNGLRMASTDGLKWDAKQTGEEGEHIHSLVFTGKEFVGVGLGATYFSSNGLTWARKPNTDAPVCCAFGKDTFVGAIYKGKIFVSKDALTWKQVMKCDHHIQAIAFV